MKTYTLLLLFFSSSLFAINTIENKTESTISQVTVYLTGAEIKRNASVDVKSGINEIILYDLSPNIDENSIQISGLKNTSVLSINFTMDYLLEKQYSEASESLKIKLKKALLSKNEIVNEISGLSQEQKIFDSNQTIGYDKELSLESIQKISTYYRKRSIAIKNEIYLLTQKQHIISQEIDNIQHEINKIDDFVKTERGEIRLKIDAQVAANLLLKIRYNVTQAGWFPMYDIKTESIETPLNISYKANVYQKTGTDWKNVNIILSTGDPDTNNSKPEVNTKYLYFSNKQNITNNVIKRSIYKFNPTVKKVNGMVVDQYGNPLPGVSIIEKGTTNGTVTDFDGLYFLDIKGGKELEFSFAGLKNKTTPIYATQINETLMQDDSELEEVVIIGYGTKKNVKKSRVKAEEIKQKEDYNTVV
ncbi:mucoidy inhibitor MuiA family protein [Aquimarina pacifica]|uniref:mucoidy inhibitor MuiA family protein n=1 Tax=Aquimarina pacifica TaxID=1296415 RepID=UPI0004AF7286|nr:mucoidy inhibitor MuiA family protein [Aquimarina pacifica]